MNRRIFLVLTVGFVIATLFLFTPVYSFYSDKHPVLEQIRERFTVLDPKFGNIPLRVGDKAYTEDKAVITLCIVNPHTNKFYDINTLMYVALHELAHTLTKADGEESHGDEFKQNFARLLKLAQDRGIYDATQPIPVAYCGVEN
jgi:hypothetical protein